MTKLTFYLHDFLSIANADVTLSGLTVLYGPSDSGKTALSAALYNILQFNLIASTHKNTLNTKISAFHFSLLEDDKLIMTNDMRDFLPVQGVDFLISPQTDVPVSKQNSDTGIALDMIKSAVNGVFFYESGDDEYSFKRNDGVVIPGYGLGGYLATFVHLWDCVVNNALTNKTVWILDQIEEGLDPSYILALANIIIQLQKETNVSIFVTTKSPLFVTALAGYSKKEHLGEAVRVYTLTPADVSYKYNTNEVIPDCYDFFASENTARDMVQQLKGQVC